VKRLLPMALLVAIILMPLPAAADQHDWRWDRCRYARLDGEKGFSTREIARTIECAVGHWEPVYGGVEKAKAVASCESGMDAEEYGNPPYMGVYQWHPTSWSSATSNYREFMDRWSIPSSAFNGRSNVLISARVFHHTWAPWSCA